MYPRSLAFETARHIRGRGPVEPDLLIFHQVAAYMQAGGVRWVHWQGISEHSIVWTVEISGLRTTPGYYGQVLQ